MVEAMTPAFRRALTLLILLLALLAFPSSGFAHRLDEYLQATLVDIEPGAIRLEMNLTPGVEVDGKVLARIDSDHDGVISANEAAAYAEAVQRDLVVRLDQRNLALKLTASHFPEPEELRAGSGIIQLEFSVPSIRLPAGAHRLTIRNRHLQSLSVYLLNASQPRTGALQITGQQRNETQSEGQIAFSLQPPPNSFAAIGVLGSIAALLIARLAWGWRAAENAPRSLNTGGLPHQKI
jgi:hypothetical protein